MAATLHLEIQGLPELRERFDVEKVRGILGAALRDALGPVRSGIAGAAPHGKTGRLAGSIQLRIGSRRGSSLEARIVSATGYGHLVERGHRMVSHDMVKGELFSITTVSIRGASRGLNLGQRVSVHAQRIGRVRGYIIGEVAPHPFAAPVARAMEAQVAQVIEQRLVAALAG